VNANSSIPNKLFNIPIEDLKPGEPSKVYLEQYKLYLTFIDKIADRRQSANSYFLTLNTGICAALAYFFSKDAHPDIKDLYLILPVAGLILSYFWQRLVGSYRQLSSGKYEIVHAIEKHLPIAPYTAEWDVLGYGDKPTKYKPLTHVEVWVPRLFIIMYAVVLLYLSPWSKLPLQIK
jgi:hypothetical protein